MRILITGICGFAGSVLALRLRELKTDLEIIGIDNFIRPGSELNRGRLLERDIAVRHADIRIAEDLMSLPSVDWVIDAAANPSVLAGTDGSGSSSHNVMHHNLVGTINVLEFCRAKGAGIILLSTSRVYSIPPLLAIELEVYDGAFRPRSDRRWPAGLSAAGVSETFSTAPPVSLYGASKACSEAIALEYGAAFGFPVWIDRLGVLAGAGQFGRSDQGIFSYWIHACAESRPLTFTGFGGEGHQVRDCLHPRDLADVLLRQVNTFPGPAEQIMNFAGGRANSMSLSQLHAWCEDRFGSRAVASHPANRRFDVPWIVLDASLAANRFGWRPETTLDETLDEIAAHAEMNPRWLELTTGG